MKFNSGLGSVITVVLLCALTACGSDNDDDDSGNGNQTSTPNGNGDNNNTITTAPAGANGTWTLGCMAEDPDDSETAYETTTISIQDDVVTSTNNSFTDNTCQTVDDPSVFVATFSVVYGGTTNTTLGSATNIDLTAESFTIDGESPPVEITGLLGLNETEYDILFVMDNSLYTGDSDGDLDGSTAALRPTALDETSIFSRQ